jgi:hypothetical protein
MYNRQHLENLVTDCNNLRSQIAFSKDRTTQLQDQLDEYLGQLIHIIMNQSEPTPVGLTAEQVDDILEELSLSDEATTYIHQNTDWNDAVDIEANHYGSNIELTLDASRWKIEREITNGLDAHLSDHIRQVLERYIQPSTTKPVEPPTE